MQELCENLTWRGRWVWDRLSRAPRVQCGGCQAPCEHVLSNRGGQRLLRHEFFCQSCYMNKCGQDRCVSVTREADVWGAQHSGCSLDSRGGQLGRHCDDVDINELVAGPSRLRHAQVVAEVCLSAVSGNESLVAPMDVPEVLGPDSGYVLRSFSLRDDEVLTGLGVAVETPWVVQQDPPLCLGEILCDPLPSSCFRVAEAAATRPSNEREMSLVAQAPTSAHGVVLAYEEVHVIAGSAFVDCESESARRELLQCVAEDAVARPSNEPPSLVARAPTSPAHEVALACEAVHVIAGSALVDRGRDCAQGAATRCQRQVSAGFVPWSGKL